MTDRLILILDTETTGTDDNAIAIEVATIVYSLSHAAPVRAFSSLMLAPSNPAEHVNGIPSALLLSAPYREQVMFSIRGLCMLSGVCAIVAHNADFDRRFVPEEVTGPIPWVCSQDDIEWPRASTSRSIVAIALAHGVGVASAHRAMADCDLLARTFTRAAEMGADLGAMIDRGLRPKALYKAIVRYEDNHLAKAAGFRWDGEAKRWARRMAIEDAERLPFRVQRLEG